MLENKEVKEIFANLEERVTHCGKGDYRLKREK